MKKYNLLIGVTGSVASILTPKIIEAFQKDYNICLVCTDQSLRFFNKDEIVIPWEKGAKCGGIYTDKDEWNFENWDKKEGVLHIDLRNWADALLIAPLSANTLAKMANGLCDNLLTSIVRAWDTDIKPMFVAPSMNCYMLSSKLTAKHLTAIKDIYDAKIINPQEKTLACSDFGNGALAEISDIVKTVKDEMAWRIPINDCRGIPIGNHPGSFGYMRSYYWHTGVDLYCNDGDPVFACEKGKIVNVEKFTGPSLGQNHWEETQAVLCLGKSGVICYGEITPSNYAIIGNTVFKGQLLGWVKRVLPFGKERPDIPGHSLSMLHLELYKPHVKESIPWRHGEERPDCLLDPTEYLLNSCSKTLEM